MRYSLVLPLLLSCPAIVAQAQVSIGINLPGLSIGINQPVYPELVPVPGYPVYYAPGSDSNYFFYDGLYWVYQANEWYSSEWYNGPWAMVGPNEVPLYLLRVPVMYYRQPPPYFGGWDRNAPPRWGEHWGHGWERRRRGWDHWDPNAGPAPAPLPVYQRSYSGDRYPRPEQQPTLHTQNYHYQPKDAVARAAYQQQRTRAAAAPSGNGKPVEPHQQGLRPGASPGQQATPRPGGPIPPGAQPQPLPPRPNGPVPPATQHQQPSSRPNGPPAVQRPQPAPAPPQNPEAPNLNPGRRQPPPPRPNTPPAVQRPQPAPAPAQNHEAPNGNPGQHQPPPPRPNTPPAVQRPQPGPPQNHEAPNGNPGQEQHREAPGKGNPKEQGKGQGPA